VIRVSLPGHFTNLRKRLTQDGDIGAILPWQKNRSVDSYLSIESKMIPIAGQGQKTGCNPCTMVYDDYRWGVNGQRGITPEIVG
jgi:hypothetical protein